MISANQAKFPFLIKGKMGNEEINVPFISTGDLNRYIEHIEYIYAHLNVTLDLIILAGNTVIGAIKIESNSTH